MNLTNKHGVPDWLVESVRATQDEYTKGESDYTATSLSEPPMIAGLKYQYEDQLEQDLGEALPAFIGTCVHNQLENTLKGNDRYLVEQRYYRKIHVPESPSKKDFLISGQIDLYDLESQVLYDYKNTSVAKMQIGDHSEWEAQASVNRWLLQEQGYYPEKYVIGAFLKDWRRGEYKRNPNYPPIPFTEIPLPFWDLSMTEDWIRNRIVELEYSKQGIMRPCTADERWNRGGAWKLYRKGRKSAICSKGTKEECEKHLASMKKTYGNEYIEYVPGEAIRCSLYCPVSDFCSHKGPL